MIINRILIVGLGSIGLRHLRIAREKFPQAEINVLRHQVADSAIEFANGTLNSIEEAIRFAPHIAVIANPSSHHIPIAQALAEIGTHLLVEKPLASSTAGVGTLIETCKANKSSLMIGYNLRFSPALQFFRDRLNQGSIGEVLSVRCEVGQYLPTWRPKSDYRIGVSAREELGGGVLLELSHELDYLQWIFGDIDWVSATLSRQSSLEIDVEDSAHLTLGFSSNNVLQQLIGTLNMDFIRHDRTRFCIAIGNLGSLRWDGVTGEVSIFDESATIWKSLFTRTTVKDESYAAEWGEFIDSIHTGISSCATGQDGLRTLEVIEAARRSASTGVRMRVSENQPANRLNS